MDFMTISRISTLLSKTFAGDLFKLLVIYRDISASEAASRLDLHIKTAQDFLEELFSLDIVEKNEVYEKKRPYFRYSLKKKKLRFEVDFSVLYNSDKEESKLKQKIRERINSGAMFTTSGNNSLISSVTVFTGEGRKRKERKINLTLSQGKFFYHLPFPNAEFKTIKEIMKKADIEESLTSEIIDIVEVMKEFNVIEYPE